MRRLVTVPPRVQSLGDKPKGYLQALPAVFPGAYW